MRANNVSLTCLSTSPGEEESKAWAASCNMPEVVAITNAAGTPRARSVPHHESQPALREEVEVVEVAPYFPSGPVIGSNLPTFQFRHFLGK
jgi:hypothetical protein